MELFKSIMSKFGAAFMALCFVTTFALAAPQDAQAEGFELGGDFSYVAEVYKGYDDGHGFAFTLTGGYRFLDWVGVYLDQQLGGSWYGKHDDEGHFLGSTVVSAKFFYEVSDLEIWGQFGVGAGYDSYDAGPAKNVSDGAFVLKLGAGVQYQIMNDLYLGGKFTYQLFAFDDKPNAHVINLGVTVMYQF